MALEDIVACQIHPAIGIARVGDSPDSYFIGPETPGLHPDETAVYKDAVGRIRRQAARFRIFGLNAAGQIVAELNSLTEAVTVRWSVEVANLKAAGVRFSGVRHDMRPWDGPDSPEQLRNRQVSDRGTLEITPSLRSIAGVSQSGDQYAFSDGAFAGRAVYLGELRTDDAGRLVFLGGRGASTAIAGARPLTQYADNDGWHDDTCDGRVSASVAIGGRDIPLKAPSWVIVAPPKFAPFIRNTVPLSEIMLEAGGEALPQTLSFTDDIYPHFAAFADQQWVNGMALRGHGPQRPGNFRDPATIDRLNDNSEQNATYRATVFAHLREPGSKDPAQANYNFMPLLSGDEGDCKVGAPDHWLSLPPRMFEALRRWKDGNFEPDWPGAVLPPTKLESRAVGLQPRALDLAALEPCVGGPFFPGIEITYFSRFPELYSEPLRFDAIKLKPGLITQRMAVPWQADFFECQIHWWPAQRPDDVLNENIYRRLAEAFPEDRREGQLARASTDRIRWDRGVGDRWVDRETDLPPNARPALPGDNDMVEKWKSLGFVAPMRTDAGEVLHVETGRSCYEGLGDRDYFFYLLNIETYPDFLPKARALAELFLGQARDRLADPTPGAIDDMYRRFPYSKEALQQRLDEIYGFYQAQAALDPLDDPDNPFQSRDDMVERIRQFAPLNQLDGAWVRNVGRAGPIDQVGALLFSVWMDEVGDGDPDQNHANVYTRLMQSVGLQLAPINTADYVYDPKFLDSAFTVPMFELAISQFTDTYYPEILGMTLQLEWEVLALWPTVKLLRNFELDSHFYELHIGIDNAANGHGAKAREAVVRFLDEAYRRGGDAEVQAVWRRIWDGYAAFATTGTLGGDLRDLLDARRHQIDQASDRVDAIMLQKKKYGSLNHGSRRADGQFINHLFEDPAAFRNALVDGGYITPGRPDLSRFFKLTSFEGPMYKVFTEDELDAFKLWTFSLSGGDKPSPVETDPAKLMAACIDVLRSQQEGVPAHAGMNLTGEDPANPGHAITQSVARWFDEPTPRFMAVLADPANKLITPGSSAKSPFLTKYVAAGNAMGAAFKAIAPNTGGKSWRQVVTDWIDQGCPMPKAPRTRALQPDLGPATRLTLTTPRSAEARHPRGRVQGMGSVH